MNRLQAEFNKNRLDFVQLFKKINHIIRQAIRSCCNGKGGNIRMLYCFCKFPFKHMGRGICVGECLKISNILSAFYFLFNSVFAAFNLLSY